MIFQLVQQEEMEQLVLVDYQELWVVQQDQQEEMEQME